MNAILADAVTPATTDFFPAFLEAIPLAAQPASVGRIRHRSTNTLRDVLVLTANASVKPVFAFPALKQPEQQLDRNAIARQGRQAANLHGSQQQDRNEGARVRRERCRLSTPRRNAPFELQQMPWRGIRR